MARHYKDYEDDAFDSIDFAALAKKVTSKAATVADLDLPFEAKNELCHRLADSDPADEPEADVEPGIDKCWLCRGSGGGKKHTCIKCGGSGNA